MLQVFVQLAGILGFLLALLHIIWQIRHEKAATSERVKVTKEHIQGLGVPYGTITVTVVNIGRVPIYLARPYVEYSLKVNPNPGRLPSVQEAGGTISFQLASGHSDPLQPGASCEFAFPNDAAAACRNLSRCHPDHLSTVVASPKGILHTIPGVELVNDFRLIADRFDKLGPDAVAPQTRVFGDSPH